VIFTNIFNELTLANVYMLDYDFAYANRYMCYCLSKWKIDKQQTFIVKQIEIQTLALQTNILKLESYSSQKLLWDLKEIVG